MTKITRRGFLRGAAGTLLLSVTPLGYAAGKIQFVAVRMWPADLYSRTTIESSQSLRYVSSRMQNPDRIVVDIEDVLLDSVIETLPQKVLARDPYIKSVRVGQYTATTVRIVFDLKSPNIVPKAFTMKPMDKFQHRLVIDFFPSADGGKKLDPMVELLKKYSDGGVRSDGTVIGESPVLASNDEESDPLGDLLRDLEKNPPKSSDKPSTTPSSSPKSGSLSARQKIIVLDPGHGGDKPGAHSIHQKNLIEKQVNLEVARMCKKELESKGYKVLLTRNEDVDIELKFRPLLAVREKADIFVSIHADSLETTPCTTKACDPVVTQAQVSQNLTVRGADVYFLNPKGARDAVGEFLEKNQSEDNSTIPPWRKGTSAHDQAVFEKIQKLNVAKSKKLASIVHRFLGNQVRMHNRSGAKGGNYQVLRNPQVVGILVELAFMSNAEDSKLLASQEYRRKVTNGICEGIHQYLRGIR